MTVVLDNQDLTLTKYSYTGRISGWTQYCRGAEHAQRPEAALTSQMVSLGLHVKSPPAGDGTKVADSEADKAVPVADP